MTAMEEIAQHPGLISNDVILAASILALVFFAVYETFYSKHRRRRKEKDPNQLSLSKSSSHRPQLVHAVPLGRRYLPVPQAVFQGMPKAAPTIMDAAALCRYVPPKIHVFELSADVESEFTSSEETKEQPVESKVIGLPNVPGCELSSHGVAKMAEEFPAATKADLVRFLVARKGNLEAASEMYRKATTW